MSTLIEYMDHSMALVMLTIVELVTLTSKVNSGKFLTALMTESDLDDDGFYNHGRH